MVFDWSQGPLAEGLKCYRARQFFEAHEHWESVWLGCPQPEKKFLQALIQVTVGFHHLHRDNRIGAVRLLTASLRKLDSYPDHFGDIDLCQLGDSLRASIEAIERGAPVSSVDPPQIR